MVMFAKLNKYIYISQTESLLTTLLSTYIFLSFETQISFLDV